MLFTIYSKHGDYFESLDYEYALNRMEKIMFTLFVEGIPAIKLGSTAEIPARQGDESWRVIDATGQVIASYR